jgi:small subunit ribosomal protein S21
LPHKKNNEMIRVSIKEKEDINRALKRFKKKFEKSQVIKDYRSNAFYTKKSVMLREEKLRASYVQKLKSKEL